MKHILAALALVAALGAGCDRGDRTTNDKRVPKSTDTTVNTPAGAPGGAPPAAVNKDSAGGMEADTASNSVSNESSSNTTSGTTSGSTDMTVQEKNAANNNKGDEGTMSSSDRKEREGRTIAKTPAKKHGKAAKPKAEPTPAPSPTATPEEHSSNIEQNQDEDLSLYESNDQSLDEPYNMDQQYEKGGMASSEQICANDPFSHPKYLRTDLAFSDTGQDCEGNLPLSYSISKGLPSELRENSGRVPASEKQQTCMNHEPWSHPLWLRTDIAFSVTGEDCYGSKPYSH